VILPDSTDATTLGGYVLDGLGGLHPFGRAPFIPVSGWSWDIARGIAVLPTATYTDAGGYILDGWGGIHVFGNAPTMNVGGWPGWDIAKSITLWTGATGTPGGWVLDGFGGMNVFGSAPGKAVSGYWNGWDIARGSGGAGSGGGGKPLPPPKAKKHKIVVNLGAQHLWAYEGDSLLLDTDVATGRPALPTPPGDYHIFFKSSPYVMHSPWPYGSPYWYPDVWMNYAMEFRSGGYFLHDAPWRTHYGPGTNLWDGTHGCVNVPLAPMARLYAWAQLDDEVLIQP
jgi:hypothetical protein